jgi:hypothetical protein
VIRLVSPRLDPPAAVSGAPGAVRLTTLDGVVLGLLANGKANSARLLDLIADDLARRHAINDVVRITKSHPSLPPADADVEILASQTLAVLSAIGD